MNNKVLLFLSFNIISVMNIYSSYDNYWNNQTDEPIQVHVNYVACQNEDFSLAPGEEKNSGKGLCGWDAYNGEGPFANPKVTNAIGSATTRRSRVVFGYQKNSNGSIKRDKSGNAYWTTWIYENVG